MSALTSDTQVKTTVSKLWGIVVVLVTIVIPGVFYCGAKFNAFLNEQKKTNEQLVLLNNQFTKLSDDSWSKYDMELWSVRLARSNINLTIPDTTSQIKNKATN